MPRNKTGDRARRRWQRLWDQHWADLKRGGPGLIDPVPAFIYSPYHLAGRVGKRKR